ncbi:MAG: hypothetical protein K6G15_04095 [Desulfovibrio sp.]|nr:hypothetical protein [Desulfovibrio sp.]
MTRTGVQGPGKTEKAEHSYSLSHTLLYSMLACIVLVVGIVALLLCRAQARYSEQTILTGHRDKEQAYVETVLENIRSWQSKTLDTIHYVSQAEMFRLFAKDYQEAARTNPSDSSDLNSMGEELDYLRDLLRDTAQRRGWHGARIVTENGDDLVAERESQPLSAGKKAVVAQAGSRRGVSYSSLYEENGHLFLDIVDPLYEVLSMDEPKIVGYLLLTLKMDNVVLDFFSGVHLKDDTQAYLLTPGPTETACIGIENGKAALLTKKVQIPQALPFDRRLSQASTQEVFSLGARIAFPLWYAVMECRSDVIDGEINGSAREIYGLGVLGSLSIALFLAMVVGTWIVRHKAKEEQRCIGGLVHAIECALDGTDAKFRYLQGRSHKVANLSTRLGKQMHLSSQAMENMQLAARLSQVGKIFVPRDIMIKRGLLTDEERRQVQLAPYHAYNVLKGVLPGRVARIVYQMGGKVVDDPETGANHELTVKEMLPEARILLVANDFCAMVSQRGNRPPLPMADARRKLSERDLYDKTVVAAINTLSDAEIKLLLDTPGDAPTTAA